MKQRVRDLKKLGDYQDILDYLNSICRSRDNISFVKDVVLEPTIQRYPYLILDIDGFLYKSKIYNFLRREHNRYELHNCLTPIELIKNRIKSVHGDSLTLSENVICGGRLYEGVELHCPIHGNFITTNIQGIFNGRGCPKCSDKRVRDNNRKGLDFFVRGFREEHGDRFNYLELIRNKGKKPKVLIECKLHGRFIQETDAHRLGKGCPKCTKDNKIHINSGWSLTNWIKSANKSKKFDSFKLYVIECESYDGSEFFYKIGRTYTTVKERYHRKRDMPYRYKLLCTVGSTSPEFIFKLENEIKVDMAPYKYFPKESFGGMTECFNKKPILDEYINKH